MRKLIKSALCILLLACLAGGYLAPGASALSYRAIDSAQELLELAENCRLDSYSRGLTVSLKADIDLEGVEFEGIPTFGGTFMGNGHSITGLSVTGDGSVKGLFRYLQTGALVTDLTVEGTVAPGGSRNTVGGIVGENRGILIGCSFVGTVSGAQSVGGIAGVNAVGGIIEGCSVQGEIHGSHFVGGIAGENVGVIRGCENLSEVNATAQQNSVELSDVTLETLTGAESVTSVTDIGGIVGGSSGVIRSCVNRGTVGYRHMGYNVGGIVGSQSGYVTGCNNFGAVYGRKEVGGIVGQIEPMTNIEYHTDTLQMIQAELSELEELTNRAMGNAQGAAGSVSGQIGRVQGYINDAQEAIDTLLPDRGPEEFPEDFENIIPDEDTIIAARNALGSSMSGIYNALNGAIASLGGLMGGLSSDMGAIGEKVGQISALLDGASENLGGTVSDVSDLDTELDLTGKVADCRNAADVLGDLNVGGIVGAICIENDLDPEEDLQISGETTLNMSTELRAVVLRCENSGAVTGSKQCIGGIAGWTSMGLVRDCFNRGTVGATAAEYVGGIVGLSQGYIRSCQAKCVLTGAACIGGIAGQGVIATDCRSMVVIDGGSERLGAVLGIADDGAELSANYYLAVGTDIGAVDGISYSGLAEGLDADSFFALEGLNIYFQIQTITFIDGDEISATVMVVYGDSIPGDKIPAFADESGTGCWLDKNGLEPGEITFDCSFTAHYTYPLTVLQSEAALNGRPLLLAEGGFSRRDEILIDRYLGTVPQVEDGETADTLAFRLPGGAQRLHYLITEDVDTERAQLMLLGADGTWRQAQFTVDGSYMIFSVNADDTALCIFNMPRDYSLYIAAGAALALVTVAAIIAGSLRKRRKAAAQAETEPAVV